MKVNVTSFQDFVNCSKEKPMTSNYNNMNNSRNDFSNKKMGNYGELPILINYINNNTDNDKMLETLEFKKIIEIYINQQTSKKEFFDSVDSKQINSSLKFALKEKQK